MSSKCDAEGPKNKARQCESEKKESLFPWKRQELLAKNKTTQLATDNKTYDAVMLLPPVVYAFGFFKIC